LSNSRPTLNASPRAVRAAIDVLDQWQLRWPTDEYPLDRSVAAFFRAHHEYNSAERRWISAALYGTVRLLQRQKAILKGLGRKTSSTDLINLWKEENDASEGASELSVEYQEALANLPGPDSAGEHLRTTLSFPDDLAGELERLLGEQAPVAAEAFNLQAPTTIRVNTLKANRAKLLRALPESVPLQYSPWGLELSGRINVHEVPEFRKGWFEVQEEASQLAALLTDAKPGMTVVDIGAGSGGKTLALGAMMQNKGSIVALDHSETRLSELVLRAKRAGLTEVYLCPVNIESDGIWHPGTSAKRTLNRLYNGADCVLVDAPCTGTGTLRRSPDTRWRVRDYDTLTAVQSNLLQQSAALVKIEGCLIYVTCAFESRQNEEVLEQFLASPIGANFRIEDGQPALTAAVTKAAVFAGKSNWPAADVAHLFDGPFLRTWPHSSNLDAFFAARLVRFQ